LNVNSAALLLDGKTVSLAVSPDMQAATDYGCIVHGVKDKAGNMMAAPDTIGFAGVSTPDITDPVIVDRTPQSGASNVGIGQSVVVTFSEGMDYNSVEQAFSWTGPGGNVAFGVHTDNSNVFLFTPDAALQYGSQYNVGFAALTARDWNLNYLAASSWSFTTTSTPDNTPPTVVSTSPAEGELKVPLDKTIQITFSEPIDPNSMQGGSVLMTPESGNGIVTWSNSGKTMNYQPDSLLLPDTTYSLLIIEGAVSDFAGNHLASSYPFAFSTGPSLPGGRFSGTIAGDPNSNYASDPSGAIVAAFTSNPFQYQGSGPPPIGGSAVVGPGGSYSVMHLEDGYYFPFSIMDSNDDGQFIPDYGDAVGTYGVVFTPPPGPMEPDSILIAGGNPLTGIDFALFDPEVISGRAIYIGTTFSYNYYNYNYFVGAFDTVGFDTTGGLPQPDYGTSGNMGWDDEYQISSLEVGLSDGTYFIGAFLDINGDSIYDPAVDPAGFYEVGGSMEPVTVQNGSDAMNIDIEMDDPGSGPAPPLRGGRSWIVNNRVTDKRQLMLRRLSQAISAAMEKRGR